MEKSESSMSPEGDARRDEVLDTALDTAIRENLVTAVPEVVLPTDDLPPTAVAPQGRRAAATFIFLCL